MSKYIPLWEYVKIGENFPLELTFGEIEGVLGFPLDHSFLNAKRETEGYGFTVAKISMKKRTVVFEKKGEAPL